MWLGEDGSLGREDHGAQTSDFLCLLSKTVRGQIPGRWRARFIISESDEDSKEMTQVSRII